MIPIIYWRILVETPDPAAALTELIARNGLDPLKIRQRDTDELEAFRTLVRFICQREQSPEAILEHVGNDLLRHEVLVTLDEVLRLFEALPATSRIMRFVRLVARVESLRESPDSVTIKEARAALEEARGLAAASWRHAAVADRYRAAISELNVGWAHWTPTIEDQIARRRLYNVAGTAERRLTADADCDIAEQLSAYAAAVEALQSLIQGVHERARKAAAEEEARLLEEKRLRDLQEESRRQRLQEEAKNRERDWAWRSSSTSNPKEPRQMSLDELLVFFNFAPGSRPTFSEIKGAFKVVAQSSQPRPGDANYAAKNSRYRDAVDAFKTLKAAMND